MIHWQVIKHNRSNELKYRSIDNVSMVDNGKVQLYLIDSIELLMCYPADRSIDVVHNHYDRPMDFLLERNPSIDRNVCLTSIISLNPYRY